MEEVYVNNFELRPIENDEWNSANGFCFDEFGNVCIVWEEEKGYWCLPGGGREGDETPEETFIREVMEEAQAEAVDVEYFHCVYTVSMDTKKRISPICFRFICNLKNIKEFVPRKKINAFTSEIDERKFVSLGELPEYITWLKDTENGRDSFELLKTKI
jgi:8-oxo-dGTP pyrophosphatase MutT (NUDIX family)